MRPRKIYASMILIASSFTLNSCDQDSKQSSTIHTKENEKDKVIEPIYDREPELIEVLKHYKVPTNYSTVVFMPPTKCSSCKMGALKVLDTMQNVYILAGDSSIFMSKQPTQKCIYYDAEYIERKGLVKLYSAILTIKNNRVIKNKPLMN